ncbi:hypothetical protein AAHC03_09212 [Spirometra sp. Aus1]
MASAFSKRQGSPLFRNTRRGSVKSETLRSAMLEERLGTHHGLHEETAFDNQRSRLPTPPAAMKQSSCLIADFQGEIVAHRGQAIDSLARRSDSPLRL